MGMHLESIVFYFNANIIQIIFSILVTINQMSIGIRLIVTIMNEKYKLDRFNSDPPVSWFDVIIQASRFRPSWYNTHNMLQLITT